MAHDRKLVQTRLSIEQHDIAIAYMSFDNVSHTEIGGNVVPHARELEKALETITTVDVVVGAWMCICTVAHSRAHRFDIVRKDTFRICENLGDAFRHGDFVDGQVRIR